MKHASFMFSLLIILTVIAPAMSMAQVSPSPPQLLNSTGIVDGDSTDIELKLASDGAGHWVAAWRSKYVPGAESDEDANIVVARSSDNGATWSAPQALVTPTTPPRVSIEEECDVATDRMGNWLVVWAASDLGSTGKDLYVARSTDNGATWSDGVVVEDNGPGDFEETPRLVALGGGDWLVMCGYFYMVTGATQIKTSRSTDEGASWSDFAVVNTSYKTSVEDPVVATDEAGNWVGLWPSSTWFPNNGTPYGMLAARSSDDGETWTGSVAIAGSSGEKAYHPEIATDRNGTWVAVWESLGTPLGTGTDREIVVSRSVNNGVNWSAMAPLNSTAATDANAGDLNPVVATDGKGNWVVLWSSSHDLSGTGDTDADIHESHSLDNGLTWSAAAEFSADTAGNAASDTAPRLATDGDGNWVAGWQVTNGPANTFGTDKDLLVSSFTLGVEAPEAEGEQEGNDNGPHVADGDGDWRLDLTEMLRVVQLYNSGAYSCATEQGETEDGFQPGAGDRACAYHDSDFMPQDWLIGLSELLRAIQLFNLGYFEQCVEAEDGFCARQDG